MKTGFFLIFAILIISGCEPEYSHTKFYEFVVENHLSTSTVKIAPLNKSDFWIVPIDTFFVIPGERIIIGDKTRYDDNKKIVDLYNLTDTIESFEIFVDNTKLGKDFTKREFWNFEMGSVDESAIYTLRIDENILND
jgi:hypothetical protein